MEEICLREGKAKVQGDRKEEKNRAAEVMAEMGRTSNNRVIQ